MLLFGFFPFYTEGNYLFSLPLWFDDLEVTNPTTGPRRFPSVSDL